MTSLANRAKVRALADSLHNREWADDLGERTAWYAVFDTLREVKPDFTHNDKSGMQAACDAIRELAAAAKATPAAAGKKYMNWQPIETAPKDGCVIMLWCGDVDFGYYSKAGWRICNNGDYRDGGHGQDYLCGTDPHSQYAPPTHWMPLPEPPKDAECSPEGVP